MNFAATSRRKQAKPQKVADNEKDDSGILLSGQSMSPEQDLDPDHELEQEQEQEAEQTPVSIEEQFKSQLLASLHRSSFFRASEAREDAHNPLLPSVKSTARHIEEVEEDTADQKLMVGDKSDIFFNGFAHLNEQQLLQFYAAASLAENRARTRVESLDPESPHASQSTDCDDHDELIKNQWKEALEKNAAKDCEEKQRIKCPVDDCEYKANHIPSILLHLSEAHKDSDKGGYLNCDSCGECFQDLIEFRRHRCSSELPSTRPQSAEPQTGHNVGFERRTDSAPNLPNWTENNSFQLRNAEQQLNDLETTTSASSTDDDVSPGRMEPPLLLNELFREPRRPEHSSNVLDLSAKPHSQMPNILGHNSFLSGLGSNMMSPFGMPGQSPFEGSNGFRSPPINSGVPSTSLVTDDDWESMMEISNTDENEKIRQLVGDKVAPPTDPNQCLLCRRVLSCKSALQMHYRTHTGERPFKCKICQRAFTTKGNLKTHMGVHRSKHSIRTVSGSLQQCPICAKRFLNTGQLSQHMMSHQRPGPSSNPAAPFLFSGLLGFNGFGSSPMPLNLSSQNTVSPKFKEPPKTTPKLEPYDVMFAKKFHEQQQRQMTVDPPPAKEEKKSPVFLAPERTPGPLEPPQMSMFKIDSLSMANPLKHKLDRDVDKDLDSRLRPSPGSEASPAKQPKLLVEEKPVLILPPPEDGSNENGGTNENPLDAIQKMWKETEPTPQQRQHVTLSKHQCGVCFKHFSSSSALQIHMRTHTGDKPFKCNVCGRAFTTRGNLKVHMGTHSYSQSPSRRGRRIFDFTPELVARQQLLNQMAAVTSAATSASTSSPTPSAFGFPMNFSPLLAAAFAQNHANHSNNNSPQISRDHSKDKASDDVISQNPLESIFWMLRGTSTCPICQKQCNSSQDMENHIRGHLTGSLTDSNPSAIQLKSE